ncbi:tail fiber assembly protein [Pectobacterium wasabiae]|uniref:Tail assembly protein n=1 Tax=Pectobacterium wasabiae TaxID=55208 RepID=A0AAW3ENU2_9GAMM|nr:tail fiber assembly protein [Pectobacterium wasabiae]AOR64805.1 phage tail protein [Pectobacterium wasabiae CFBP 3304]EJS93860.1 Putative tail fiber assembly [Pectobacterium wasabiae CFBP 3304]KFX09926.1 tail assembly protein [Pectobacterium wasabiae]KGA30128.1 tail assembly protein [Pectobacterium wasabiae]
MKNYSIKVNAAKLNESGLSVEAGWITIYQVHPTSREYIGAHYEYLPIGVGIPADSYSDEPELPPLGLALRRTNDGLRWEHVPDYRGQTVYSKETRQTQVVTLIGALPDNVALSEPATVFDVWDGNAWMTDKEAQQQALVLEVKKELATRLSAANTQISTLSDAVTLGIATGEEITQLAEWQTYRVLLNRIDVNKVSDINWPDVP